MENKILVLGAGNAQYDLIEYCKDRGIKVYGCSYTRGDSSEEYLDEFALINIVDYEKILDYVNEKNIPIVYSVGSDIAMPSVGKVNEVLNRFSFVSYDTAKICNHKAELRQTLGHDFKGNIPFQIIESKDDVISIDYPLIMKPVDSQGQRGVYRLDSDEDFKELYDKSHSFSRSGQLIVEEYIEGDEISVNTFSSNGQCVFQLISDRIVFDELPGGIIHKHLIPSKYEHTKVEEKVYDLVHRVLKKLHIDNGPTYFQIKIKNGNEPILLEVTPRLDGCHMWRLIEYYCGVNLLELTMNALLSENKTPLDSIEFQPLRDKVVTEFLCLPPSDIFDTKRFSVNHPYFLKWYYKNGESVKKMNGYMEKCGYMIYEG